ncbi:MAG TPA: TonB family protein [Pyrinomonadaceae bacterium]
MTKIKFVLPIALVVFSGCSSLSTSPSSVVKQLMADSWNGDVDAMVKPWSRKAIEEQGLDKIRKDAEGFAELQRKAKAAGEDMRVEKLRETIQGDRARVFFLYRDSKGKDSAGMGFALIKEEGQWKLYRAIDIGEEEQPFDSSFAERKTANPEPTPVREKDMSLPPPPPSPGASNRQPATNSSSSSPTTNSPAAISGGVLNKRAISLPQPVYPPIAKAAKAAGTVAVNITVDENGRVISASAFAGHPLLRPAAEAAARNARFNPTIVGGKRVKVTGTLTYQFSAP